ncbi:MAG TPA: DUF6524 family protein [Gemmatimonadaceae bacterium]|jgi:hypothetical protein|nr:MAG: hypothetical protein ABS52_08630 [Gemmatimonadetes bacterium SCN 70-22]HMN08102.1 DUF6524 family protein [Gemmatimonadaceae bacterium]
MATESVSWGGVALRVVAAAILVFATYNPEGFSYFHWAIAPLRQGVRSFDAAKFLVGTLLAAGWVVYVQATRRSIGLAGAVLITAICAGVIWLLISRNVMTASSGKGVARLVLAAVSIVLGIGMSWSHFSRRLSGQGDTDIVA